MDLKISKADEDERFLYECIVRRLQSEYGYSCDEAVSLFNEYYAKFTDSDFCSQHAIPVQNADFFSHIAPLGMADRVHYYQGLKNVPDEKSFVEWQRKIRA